MQGGLSCSALLDLIFPPVVGLHGTSHEGKEGWQDLVLLGESGLREQWATVELGDRPDPAVGFPELVFCFLL